ncbi:hypothetical protein L1987_73780 [Smallanthus sonchifolius]|uniref:Uncharacterized protein n=1 Tax=Smallanthus sonchifolius TaxID=185202 RepID=A0ACB9A1V5_9ASTR|nr:hypothetical protein L1987_73780 [Smallanthus sonchifolius]
MGLKGGNKVVSGNPDGRSLSPPPEFNLHHPNHQLFKQTPKMLIIFAMVGLSCLVLYHSSITFPFSGDYNSFAAGTLLPDSDADIMWFRDPFSKFDNDADFQIACDYFNGNPSDFRNLPNGGFKYVKSNNKTIQFYKFWYESRLTYPSVNEQDVFNKIKFNPFIENVGLRIRFLDTGYFGGFCQASKDLNKVCTMHANCCVGSENKVHDLGIMLGDWRKYKESPANQMTRGSAGSWTVPQLCRLLHAAM